MGAYCAPRVWNWKEGKSREGRGGKGQRENGERRGGKRAGRGIEEERKKERKRSKPQADMEMGHLW